VLTAQHPESSPCRISIQLKDGTEIRNEVRYPKGHDRSPMSADEVKDKFKGLFASYGTAKQAQRIIALVDRLDDLRDINALFASFVRRPRTPEPASARRAHREPEATVG
jgi:2-methylcitrate dehydratase PrpD